MGWFTNRDREFGKIKAHAEVFYKGLKPVKCPYLNRDIAFNALGMEHLKFKRRKHARSQQDQFMRFKLLHLAPEVLRLSRTVQGIFQTKHFERVRMHSRTEVQLLPVTYYEFIAVLGSVRVKVIVKHIQGKDPFFWSLIPFWSTETTTKKRRLFAGNLEQD